MKADRVCEGDCNTHPMPGILLVVGRLVPICHEQERLDEGDSVDLVVEVIENLSS